MFERTAHYTLNEKSIYKECNVITILYWDWESELFIPKTRRLIFTSGSPNSRAKSCIQKFAWLSEFKCISITMNINGITYCHRQNYWLQFKWRIIIILRLIVLQFRINNFIHINKSIMFLRADLTYISRMTFINRMAFTKTIRQQLLCLKKFIQSSMDKFKKSIQAYKWWL